MRVGQHRSQGEFKYLRKKSFIELLPDYLNPREMSNKKN
jgi:hypothetical protein